MQQRLRERQMRVDSYIYVAILGAEKDTHIHTWQNSEGNSRIWKPQGCQNVWLQMADDNSFALVFERMRMSALQYDSDSDDEVHPHRWVQYHACLCPCVAACIQWLCVKNLDEIWLLSARARAMHVSSATKDQEHLLTLWSWMCTRNEESVCLSFAKWALVSPV